MPEMLYNRIQTVFYCLRAAMQLPRPMRLAHAKRLHGAVGSKNRKEYGYDLFARS